MANALTSVEFHGATLSATLINGVPFVALKPICEAIGLDWAAQYTRIKRHPVLAKGVVVTTTPSSGGDQQTLMLPLDKLNGWLFGVSVSRVKPELRERLTQYQTECFDVLARHFLPTAPNPSALNYTRISPAQAQHLKELVQLVAESGKQTHGETWARLHRKMKVNSYLELSASRFDEACQYLSSKMDDTSMAVLIQKHFPRADQALQAPSLINRRWLVSLDRAGREIVQPIDQDAYVGTLHQLTTGITDPGVLFTTAELLALGTACAQRLASRRSPELLTLAQATTAAAFAATQAQWSQQPLIAHG